MLVAVFDFGGQVAKVVCRRYLDEEKLMLVEVQGHKVRTSSALPRLLIPRDVELRADKYRATARRRAIVAKIEAGPIPAVDGVVRWRLIDLAPWVFEEYGISVTKQILSRELRALGYRKLSARPRHHAKDKAAADVYLGV